ncbi:MAG: 2-amino-4-hydroxy-6-hydroxymethyldihydropteridine diphosphokinase [Clostridia bacterium]|nr:2-amino-4-hydroxy-6-hydroxymethyldihydropteridine diphosphokinase [Clostridia bacterium]
MSYDVFLSLGSNIGSREKNLLDAVRQISQMEGTDVKKLSNIYETDPVGYEDQDRFLNMAVWIETSLEPLELLEKILGIESVLKRVREIRWGPRTIDIDILLYGDRHIDLPQLTVPHPRMFERAFVLVPLKELLGKKNIGFDIDNLINLCNDKWGIKLYKRMNAH